MSERVWHKGPVPFQSWWLTREGDKSYGNEWRWWDGMQWSLQCYEHEDGSDASVPSELPMDALEWTDYWPENARVPRLDPTGGHWTFNVDGEPPDTLERLDICYRDGSRSWNVGLWYWLGRRWELLGNDGDILAWRPAA